MFIEISLSHTQDITQCLTVVLFHELYLTIIHLSVSE